MNKVNIENKEPTLEEVMLAMRDMMTTALLVEARKLGFTLSHFEILRHIAESNTVTMKDIAEKLHITPPSASALVDTLVQKDLVARKIHEEDRRTVYVTLTIKTYKLFSDMHKNKDKVFTKILSKLDAGDKKDLIRILNKCTKQ